MSFPTGRNTVPIDLCIVSFKQDPELTSNTGADPGSGIPTTTAATEPPPQTGITIKRD